MIVIDDDSIWRALTAAARAKRVPPVRLGHADTTAIRVANDFCWETSRETTTQAAQLLDCCLPVALGGPDFYIGQLGQSLDGRIATESGHSHYVTGPASRVHLHRLRALVDAVVVGAGTVAADDPQLTVRHVQGMNPVRVVFDPSARLGPDRRVFADDRARTLHCTREGRRVPGMPRHVETVAIGDARGPALATRLRDELTRRDLTRVLVEGGGITVSHFLDAGILDRLHVVVAPLLIGSGRPALALAPVLRLDSALRPPTRTASMGDDMFFDLDLASARQSDEDVAPG